jgi:DNA-binding transcriptional MocR family regulator
MTTSPQTDTVRSVPQVAKAHEQVAEHYRQAIAAGEYDPPKEFPSVRDVIDEWDISTNTAQRALRLLRDEGWIEFRQGRRPDVKGVPEVKPPP